MDIEHQLHRDRVSCIDVLDGEDHGVDVPEDLDGRDIGRVVAKTSGGFCAQKSSCSDLQSFDPRRGDGLRTEQDAGEHLGIDEARRFGVQASDGSFSIRDVARDVTVDGERTSDEVGAGDRASVSEGDSCYPSVAEWYVSGNA